jgi:predicted NAD/FAD-binding protein
LSGKIAIIGGGISGLSSAWHISQTYNVTLFEKNNYLGGHANTILVSEKQNKVVPVDVGFMVFNELCYPNLIQLFQKLGVQSHDSDMGFSVSDKIKGYEYSGSGLSGYFGQRKNLFSLRHWGQLLSIVRFYTKAQINIKKYKTNTTLLEFLKSEKLSDFFIENHIIPMCSAIWSCDDDEMLSYPAHDFVSFFINHGLFKLKNRPKWKSVAGGSKEYVEAIKASHKFKIKLNANIIKIEKKEERFEIILDNGEKDIYDKLILASPADESKKLIESVDEQLADLLTKFKYQKNLGILHSDPDIMPISKKIWASWNYIRSNKDSSKLSVTYWLNSIQKIDSQKNYFLTLNHDDQIQENQIHKQIYFSHPIFDLDNKNTKKKL